MANFDSELTQPLLFQRERQENEKIAAEEKRSDEQRKLAVEREREREEEKLRQEKELQNVLKEQMEELRKRESDVSSTFLAHAFLFTRGTLTTIFPRRLKFFHRQID